MDKRIILAVAGSGKTSYLIDKLNKTHKALILTYTKSNFENIIIKIKNKNQNLLQNNVIMTYFEFLYNFCYKPFLADIIQAKGIDFKNFSNKFVKKEDECFYFNDQKQFYSNRLALFLQNKCLEDIKLRIVNHFDLLLIDEVQDFAGRDFEFLLNIIGSNIDTYLVGDFYQHTYSTSNDRNKNSNLFDNYDNYINMFKKNGFECDETLLYKSNRCTKNICNFITEQLKINIESNRNPNDEGEIKFVDDNNEKEIESIFFNNSIVKLHYQSSNKYGLNHKNWGEVKGLDCFEDVCVVLNKKTYETRQNFSLLSQQTKNKLYVAITRARRNVYFINEEKVKKYKLF